MPVIPGTDVVIDPSTNGILQDGDDTGYNTREMKNLNDAINNAMTHVGKEITDKIEQEIIDKVSTNWYAGEAKEYFKDVHDTVANAGVAIQQIFSQFRDQLQESGEHWASETKNIKPDIGFVKQLSLNLNYGKIKNIREDGAVVLNEKGMNMIAEGLNTVEEDIKNAIAKHAEELDASTSFMGHGQPEAIRQCFDRILEEVHRLIQKLVVGDKSIQSSLLDFKRKYQNIAMYETSRYKGTTVNIGVTSGN